MLMNTRAAQKAMRLSASEDRLCDPWSQIVSNLVRLVHSPITKYT
jgi:hypothetical protein